MYGMSPVLVTGAQVISWIGQCDWSRSLVCRRSVAGRASPLGLDAVPYYFVSAIATDADVEAMVVARSLASVQPWPANVTAFVRAREREGETRIEPETN